MPSSSVPASFSPEKTRKVDINHRVWYFPYGMEGPTVDTTQHGRLERGAIFVALASRTCLKVFEASQMWVILAYGTDANDLT